MAITSLSAGAMYGNGSYFTVDPNYSAQGYAMLDPLGHRRMYLAKGLVGDFTKGQAPTPPKKNHSDLYDSWRLIHFYMKHCI